MNLGILNSSVVKWKQNTFSIYISIVHFKFKVVMNFYIQKGMKHLVLVRFNQYIRIVTLYIFPRLSPCPRAVEVTASASLWLNPVPRNSGSRPVPRHSAGSRKSIRLSARHHGDGEAEDFIEP